MRLVQVASEDHVGPRRLDPVEPPRRIRHGRAALVARNRHEVVVNDQAAQILGVGLGEDPLRQVELGLGQAAVHDRPVRRGRREGHERRAREPRYGVELGIDEATPIAERREKPLPDAVERHVVIARRRDDGHVGEPVEKLPRRAVLPHLRALRQVPGRDDDVGLDSGHQAEQRLRGPREERPPALPVGGVQHGEREALHLRPAPAPCAPSRPRAASRP